MLLMGPAGAAAAEPVPVLLAPETAAMALSLCVGLLRVKHENLRGTHRRWHGDAGHRR